MSKRPRGAFKGGRKANNAIYANPLPVLFSDPATKVRSVLGLLGLSLTTVSNPHCEGVFDPATKSVWITGSRDSILLWQRGFFGKGDLSRSEPTWLSRQIKNKQKGGYLPTASLLL
jgi:tRNA-splicing endonuclease subunit Sen2